MFGEAAFEKVSQYVQPTHRVLDVGCGVNADASRAFIESVQSVLGVDRADTNFTHPKFVHLKQDFFGVGWDMFDVVWVSHVVEHALNPHTFLTDITESCVEGGIIAITVPPMKQFVVGGHVNLFNAGILIYRMILSGLDMKHCQVLQYRYNVSVVVRKRAITLPTLKNDCGDIQSLSEFFPEEYNTHGFNGDIRELNWEETL